MLVLGHDVRVSNGPAFKCPGPVENDHSKAGMVRLSDAYCIHRIFLGIFVGRTLPRSPLWVKQVTQKLKPTYLKVGKKIVQLLLVVARVEVNATGVQNHTNKSNPQQMVGRVETRNLFQA
jgi:hypothetical protein